MAKKKEINDLETVHKESLDAFALSEETEKDQREKGVEDMLFVDSEEGQWDDNAKVARKGRPMYTIDLTSEALNQMIGEQRQSRTRIKISPNGGGADKDTANIYDGIIRKIENQAESAYDNSFKEKLKGGYGGWRYLTQFTEENPFNQEIVPSPINSAVTSLYFDVDAQEYDKSDSKRAWLITDMSHSAFKVEFPKANLTDFNSPELRRGNCANWFSKDSIRVAESWEKKEIIKNIALMSDGRVIDIDEAAELMDELKKEGITIIKQRPVKSHKVVMYKMNGAEILSGPHAWDGKYIPLVPDYGEISHVGNRTFVRGKVRKAKDAARIYNYTTSAKIEATALSGKDPLMVTDVMIKGNENDYETIGSTNKPVIKFTADPDVPGAVPFRLGAPAMQTALIEQTQQAANDVHSTLGIHNPALGNAPQLLSEKAVLDQAEKGDRGSFEYSDNHQKSKLYGAKILLDLIPKIYDTPQIIQILNADGSLESHEINMESVDKFGEQIKDEQTGKVIKINDLSLGTYTATAETGPTYKTMRAEAVTQLTEMAAVSPMFEQLSTDLIAKNMNIPESEEIHARIRKQMIAQKLIEPTDDEIKELGLDQQQPPSEGDQALVDNVKMQTEEMMTGIENTEAKTQETLVKTQESAVDTYNTLLTSFQKQVDLGIPLSPQQRNLLITQGDIVADAQAITQEGEPNSEQAADIAQQIQTGQLRPEDLQ
jgi:hypothetical protein